MTISVMASGGGKAPMLRTTGGCLLALDARGLAVPPWLPLPVPLPHVKAGEEDDPDLWS